MKYLSVKEMISIELAANAVGHSYQAMMEAAGEGLAREVQERYSDLPEKQITALVGPGNNGGDALVALDYLNKWGWKTSAILAKNRPHPDNLADRVINSGTKLVDWSSRTPDIDQIAGEISGAQIILDSLLGTGIKLPLRGAIKELLERLNHILDVRQPQPLIIAVDCPSGVDCDTGEVDPSTLAADLTVTMGAVKKGLLEFPAYQYLGELCLVDIGVPVDLPEMTQISREVLTVEWVKSILPARPANAHKGTFGAAMVIGGSEEFPGAPLLAGEAAYRAGAGLVRIAVPAAIYTGVIGILPEATWLRLEDQQGGISESAISQIVEHLDRMSSCLVGPGLGRLGWTGLFLNRLLEQDSLPRLILDADALRLARVMKNWPGLIPKGSVLTPHPGEMAMLTGLELSAIQADRMGAAEKYSQEWEQIVVLKGTHTIIAEPSGRTFIYLGGNPGLATAGSGDVLAGVIAGMIAQGLPAFEAAAAGVWIHGQAGKMAGIRAGSPAAVLAGDINRCIGEIYPD